MRRVLHILTGNKDAFAGEVIALQSSDSDLTVRVFDLSQGNPDYTALVEAIFEADSIEVW